MTTYPPQPAPGLPPRSPQADPINPWLIRLPVLVFAGCTLLALLIALAIGGFQVLYANRIVPNVWSNGVALGGLTPLEAVRALDASFTYDDDAVFTFRDGDRFWQATAGELGVRFDAETAAARAFAIGHDQGLFNNIIDQTLAWLNGESIAADIDFDQSAAAAFLTGIAAEINRAPADATLVINGADIQATPGAPGRSLDITSTLAAINQAITTLQPGGELPLAIRETPPVALDSMAAASSARTALSAPIVLVADDGRGGALGPWTIPVEQIQSLLRVETVTNADGTLSYSVAVDPEVYRPSLEALAQGLILSPQDGRFHYDPSSGQLVSIRAASPGRRLDVDATLQQIETAIFSPAQRVVPLVFDYIEPRFGDSATAAGLGITELVSEGVSYYTGSSEARRSNIAQAVSRFDGLIIAPGEEFSFNRELGDVTPEDGFVEGFVIIGDRTVRGVGGGVCQVSTTAFRAAFYAGYPITERWAHGYRVGYYESGDPEGVGMDAAIYTPDLDMKFVNDTPYHLLIESFIDPTTSSVHFRFYSTNPGRIVTREPAEIVETEPAAATQYVENASLTPGQQVQVDWAAEGAYVRVLRIITDANGVELKREYFASQYQPWGAVVQVAPGDSRLSG